MIKLTDNIRMGFEVKDCSLITRMAGVKEAMNLRELEERLRICPDECLFYHFCETVIRPTFDYPDYPNDFALWANSQLRDKILAERLAVINPYKFQSFDELRKQILDIIEERLSEIDHIPWVPKGSAFQFLRAATIVFNTGIILNTQKDFRKQLPKMSLGSIYYHFVEARRRNNGRVDDFTEWLNKFNDKTRSLIYIYGEIDFYFLSLTELKDTLIAVATEYLDK